MEYHSAATTYTENSTGGPGRNCVERGKSKTLSNIYILYDSICKSLKSDKTAEYRRVGQEFWKLHVTGGTGMTHKDKRVQRPNWFRESTRSQMAQNLTPESPVTSDSAGDLHPYQSPDWCILPATKEEFTFSGNHLRLLGNLSTFATADKCMMTLK